MASSTPRVIQIKLDITLDDRKLYNAPTVISNLAQEVAHAAIEAVEESPSAASAVSVDVEWAWLYAWASGRSTVAVDGDLDPSAEEEEDED